MTPDPGPGPHRLIVGVGARRVPGWTSADLDTEPGELRDVVWEIPLADHSCEAIFCEQLVERLRPFGEVPPVLRECRRVLRPAAPIRIVAGHVGPEATDVPQLGNRDVADLHPWSTTPMAAVQLTPPAYDPLTGTAEELVRRLLHDAGFVGVRRTPVGHSDHAGLALDEAAEGAGLLAMEARAPGDDRTGPADTRPTVET